MKKRGFTLIELMIVISIIGLLSTIAIPRFAGITEDAKIASVQGNLSTLRTATAMYRAQNGDVGVHEMFNVRAEEEGGETDFIDIKDSFYESFYPKKKIPPFVPGENLDGVRAGVTYSAHYDGTTQPNNDGESKVAYIVKVENDNPKSTYIEIYARLAANTYGGDIQWGSF